MAGAAAGPHAQARASLLHCRTVLATLHAGPATRKTVPALKRAVAAARAACNQGARLSRLGEVNSDRALMQAGDAELGVLDGLSNYGKYLADVAAGKTGHTKILNYALEELRQAKLLIAEALTELK
jgi:hypothetical protein